MNLEAQVQAVFASDGTLAQAIPDFRPRAGQQRMAQAVARTLTSGGVLVVEAGTGVGKTFAYLVPALLSGERVLLSTATKTLQDQLFARDLPRLARELGLPLRMALLKGRSSYLCLHRLELARQDASAHGPASAHGLSRIAQWAALGGSGDLAELPGLDERSPLIPLVTSTRENCLGAGCPRARDCHVNHARREAMAADVVVINHHLFFADLAVRESGMAELLPRVRCVIFDEAHQLNETGIQFLGRQLGTGQLTDFARDLLACGLQQARGLVDWRALASALERGVQDLRLSAGRLREGVRLSWQGRTPEQVDPDHWQAALQAIEAVGERIDEALALVEELGPDFARLRERGEAWRALVSHFGQPAEEQAVRWLDVQRQLRLVESPLDIAAAVQSRLLGGEEADKAWIFTSATLGDDASLSWFTTPCGLEQAEILRVPSPFDYPQQSWLYLPADLPRPNEAAHSTAVAALVARLAAALGGRTLVLTTTLRALRTIGETLQQRLATETALTVLMQGQLPKRELLERFRQAAHGGQSGCVLVASASFWEGVDIPGAALQLVVIDKLPFPPPDDPLVQARSRRLQAQGGNPFNAYFVAEAAVALKQGAGRLIRSETDRGALVICDTRLRGMAYGRRLLAALPPMQRLDSEAGLMQVLGELAGADGQPLG